MERVTSFVESGFACHRKHSEEERILVQNEDSKLEVSKAPGIKSAPYHMEISLPVTVCSDKTFLTLRLWFLMGGNGWKRNPG